MAQHLLKARSIYTNLLKDSTLTEKQKEDITYYGLLTVNIAAAEVASKKEDKEEAEKNIRTALEYFGEVPKQSTESNAKVEKPAKEGGARRYMSGGKMFVFDDSVDNILNKQQIALKVYPTRFNGVKLIKELKDDFGISVAEFMMMNMTEYMKYFIKKEFSDIIKKGIKNNIAMLAEKYQDIPHKQFKKSNWKKLNELVYKSLDSYPELPKEPKLTDDQKKTYRKAFSKVKKIKTGSTFYHNLYEFNLLVKKYYVEYLQYLIECVKYLDKL